MASKLDKQFTAMNSLSWRITYEWNKAKNEFLTIDQMQKIWQDIIKHDANYNCLAEKRKETIRFLWFHIRQITIAHNQLFGRWYNGKFYNHWMDLPEEIRHDDNMLAKLPSGHFWLDRNGQATRMRYFISKDSIGEDVKHFDE